MCENDVSVEKERKFKVGDLVKVLPLDKNWSNYSEDMESAVGRIASIVGTSSGFGGQFMLANHPRWFPTKALQLEDSVERQQQLEIVRRELVKARTENEKLTGKLEYLTLDCSYLQEKVIALQDDYIELLRLRLEGIRGQNVRS